MGEDEDVKFGGFRLAMGSQYCAKTRIRVNI
jgi:hypothetical protein